MDIVERFLDASEHILRYGIAVELGAHEVGEELEYARACRDEIVRDASVHELKEIARAIEAGRFLRDFMDLVRKLGYEDALEWLQTLQKGLRSGESWRDIHAEHLSRHIPIRARHRRV